jgi:preprotein translocase subunit SecE
MKNPFRKIRIFSTETVGELKKASWPTLPELRQSTIVVLVAIVILGLFVSLADFTMVNWISLLTDLVDPLPSPAETTF